MEGPHLIFTTRDYILLINAHLPTAYHVYRFARCNKQIHFVLRPLLQLYGAQWRHLKWMKWFVTLNKRMMQAWCAKLSVRIVFPIDYDYKINSLRIHYLLSSDRKKPFKANRECIKCGEYRRDRVVESCPDWIGTKCTLCTRKIEYEFSCNGSGDEDSRYTYRFKGIAFKEEFPNYSLKEEEPEEDQE